ncbi:UxaA family hydrolase [Helicobacter sp. 11S03491-1]|uniref:UxaA family hydrolase n=1 Tax=Helicobacter sp. 11S03491-1 TaxID=1476196 RepID=UPI000BA6D46A|nr:UxaA family hydrolase [Helicobacter sp. 11S03491-1]PAF42286.1 D-galactarate dehydratase [Helicobacter sp. 11S03491-1]
MKKVLIVNAKDNVATTLENLEANTWLSDLKIKILQDIPMGHKFAIRDIPKGNFIIKYGEHIGVACSDIGQGEHVHVHNIEGIRGRGDL